MRNFAYFFGLALLLLFVEQGIADALSIQNTDGNVQISNSSSNNYTINLNSANIKSGAVQLNGVPGNCTVLTRGQLSFIQSGLGVADILQVCTKTALDTYAWKVVG